MTKLWNPILLILLLALIGVGCAPKRMPLPEIPEPPKQAKKKVDKNKYTTVREQSYRTRKPIPTELSRYEGSLWEDEASWGNLLRDHRARFKGDVLSIVNLPEIISIPKREEKPAPTPAQLKNMPPEVRQSIRQANAIQEAKNRVEDEQNEVLGSLKSITARVLTVLPNGNMVIVGEKIDYRQQNTVRYVTEIMGVIRPEDVTDQNEITALKLARSEVKIKRQVIAKSIRTKKPSSAGSVGFMDKLGHLTTQSDAPAAPAAESAAAPAAAEAPAPEAAAAPAGGQ